MGNDTLLFHLLEIGKCGGVDLHVGRRPVFNAHAERVLILVVCIGVVRSGLVSILRTLVKPHTIRVVHILLALLLSVLKRDCRTSLLVLLPLDQPFIIEFLDALHRYALLLFEVCLAPLLLVMREQFGIVLM